MLKKAARRATQTKTTKLVFSNKETHIFKKNKTTCWQYLYVGQKQIVVPSENVMFEISKELDPNSGPKFLIGWNESV